MQTVIIVIHLMIVIAMIAVILLQRSEGGALGIGGGGGGGMFSARGSANLLTRATTILAVVFFVTSLGLGLLAKQQSGAPSILDLPEADGTEGTGQGILDTLRQSSGDAPLAPPTDDTSPPELLTPQTSAPTDAPAAPAAPSDTGTPQVPTNQ